MTNCKWCGKSVSGDDQPERPADYCQHSNLDEEDFEDAKYRNIWRQLSGAARETLHCLFKHGPTWDGDVPSKCGRDELLEKRLASKICMANGEDGYQAATYLGARVWRQGQLVKAAQ